MGNQKYAPRFYTGLILILYSFRIVFSYYRYRNKELSQPGLPAIIKTFFQSVALRKKLYLTKLIKFNHKYYSTPVIPGFPSEPFKLMVKNGGYNFLDAGTHKKAQIDSAFLAITNKCGLSCSHCYEKHNLNRDNAIPTDKLIQTVTSLQRLGTSIIILTGGEPFLEFEKIEKIMKSADLNLSEFHIHTSGSGLTEEKVKKIKDLGISAVAVGIDSSDPIENNYTRGTGSFGNAIAALKLLNEYGLFTYVNLCATKSLVNSQKIWEYYDLMKYLKVGIIQMLEPRPFGGYYNQDVNRLLSENDKTQLIKFMKRGNTERKYKNHPLIYYVAYVEGPDQMGCMMGGLSHFYIDSRGNVNPCVFLPVTFGNINYEEFDSIFARMRKLVPHPVYKKCPSLLLSESIFKRSRDGNEIPLPIERIKVDWDELFIENNKKI